MAGWPMLNGCHVWRAAQGWVGRALGFMLAPSGAGCLVMLAMGAVLRNSLHAFWAFLSDNRSKSDIEACCDCRPHGCASQRRITSPSRSQPCHRLRVGGWFGVKVLLTICMRKEAAIHLILGTKHAAGLKPVARPQGAGPSLPTRHLPRDEKMSGRYAQHVSPVTRRQ